MDDLKRRAKQLKREVSALALAYKDPRTPWYARAVVAVIVIYAISPIDLIPDFVPVLGYLDDLILVPLGIALALRLIPPNVMAECRILRSLPRAENAEGETISLTNSDIREFVFDRFIELLAKDRSGYCEELDFYEVRFNQALSRLRSDAREKARRDESRTLSLDIDDDSSEPSDKAEWAAGSFDQSSFETIEDEDYRSHLLAAIDTLPPEQMRIIAMLFKGIPIDSQEPGVMTIAKALGRSEKTIRTYRDKAFAALKAIMSKGE